MVVVPISPLQKQKSNNHIFHQYTIRTSYRDELKAHLEKQGIPTAVHYPTPLHLQPGFAYLGYKKSDLPESEKAAREVLSLPIYPELKKQDKEKIVKVLKKFFAVRM